MCIYLFQLFSVLIPEMLLDRLIDNNMINLQNNKKYKFSNK